MTLVSLVTSKWSAFHSSSQSVSGIRSLRCQRCVYTRQRSMAYDQWKELSLSMWLPLRIA